MNADPTISRAVVASRLADKLRELPNGDDPDVVALLSDADWAMVAAAAAGRRPGYVPSAETRDVVVAILRTRRQYTDDPFEGLS